MNTFSNFGFSAPVLKALSSLGIENPTTIQQQAIPALLGDDCDFIGLAQTGTGKTAAFGLPLIQKIDSRKSSTQSLVICPTRELGQQVAEQLKAFAKFIPEIRVEVVYGGKPIHQQIKAVRRAPHIIVATPGRLIDLVNRKALKLNEVKQVVLDEADEMLNMGFQKDIDKILTYTPSDKNTWLFSATMPNEIRDIIGEYMTNPVEVSVKSENKVNENIDHQYMGVKPVNKSEALKRLIAERPDMRAVVFCRTKRDTIQLAKDLRNDSYYVDALHGDLTQHQRDKVMRKFKGQQVQMLVATNVAARGIDVSDLSHVIHHTLPEDWAFYSHRSGRTARAGKKGVSLALVSRGEMKMIKTLENKLKISFSASKDIQLEDIADNRPAFDDRNKGKGPDKRKRNYQSKKPNGQNGNFKRRRSRSYSPSNY